jgi:hypothetical protein
VHGGANPTVVFDLHGYGIPVTIVGSLAAILGEYDAVFCRAQEFTDIPEVSMGPDDPGSA